MKNLLAFKTDMTNIIKRNNVFFMLLIIVMFLMFNYINLCTRNVVFMDYWRNINFLIEPIINDTWQWQDFWHSDFGQRNVLQLVLLGLNIKFFNLNCVIESYLSILVIAASCFVVFCEYKNLIIRFYGEKQNRLAQFSFFPIMLLLFNMNQWEILSLQFSFVFMLRLFCYIVIMFLLSGFFVNAVINWKYYLLLGVFTGFILLFISQLYWPILVLTLLIVWLLYTSIQKKFRIINFVSFWIPVVIAIGIYFYDIDMSKAGASSGLLSSFFLDGVFLKGICYMLPSCLFPQTYFLKMSSVWSYGLGVLCIIMLISAFFCFLKYHLYQYTYLPIFLCVYGIIAVLSITYGRFFLFNIEYLSSSRYTCETTLLWCGVIFIFLLTKK